MPQCQKCSTVFQNHVVIEGRNRNLQRRKFCLACSPFGKHNTIDLTKPPVQRPIHICVICGKSTGTSRRRRCASCNQKIRRYRAKLAAVAYLDGVCRECGWSGHLNGFCFHHPDDNKEFNIGPNLHKRWSVVQKELDKCMLVCARCHQILHSSREHSAFLSEVANYRGHLHRF